MPKLSGTERPGQGRGFEFCLKIIGLNGVNSVRKIEVIAFLEGKLVDSLPTRVLVNVNGVGYEVLIPLSTYEKLPPVDSRVKLLTHLQVREDEHVLFGFLSADERDLFKLLVNHVSGVGPKLALVALSGCSPEQLRTAVVQNNVGFLSKIKGVGKKTAERIVVELRDKLGVAQAWAGNASPVSVSPAQQRQSDALMALISLGYKQPDALKALKQVDGKVSTEEMVREALKKI